MISSDNLLLERHNYFEPSCFGSRGVIFLTLRNSNYFNHYFAWLFLNRLFSSEGGWWKGEWFHRSNYDYTLELFVEKIYYSSQCNGKRRKHNILDLFICSICENKNKKQWRGPRKQQSDALIQVYP